MSAIVLSAIVPAKASAELIFRLLVIIDLRDMPTRRGASRVSAMVKIAHQIKILFDGFAEAKSRIDNHIRNSCKA